MLSGKRERNVTGFNQFLHHLILFQNVHQASGDLIHNEIQSKILQIYLETL